MQRLFPTAESRKDAMTAAYKQLFGTTKPSERPVSPTPAVVDDVVLTTSGGFVSSIVGALGNLLPSTRKSHPSQDERQQSAATKPIPASGTGCQRLEFACSHLLCPAPVL